MTFVWVAALPVCALLGYVLWRVEFVAAGYKAKVLCSGVFVSQRDPDRVLSEELDSRRFPVLRTVTVDVDALRQCVTARVGGVIRRTAVFRPGLGSTLLFDRADRIAGPPAQEMPFGRGCEARAWPDGELAGSIPEYVDREALDRALDLAFEESDAGCPVRTRAVVVVHDGRIVGERYAPGVKPSTPLQGWSMAKSVLGALIGISIREGKLGLYDRELLPEWAPPDSRAEITVDQLLRMRSGLVFSENYTNPLHGVLPMLFGAHSASRYAARSRLRSRPGSQWYYSSGTTNILSRVLRNAVEDGDYLTYPRTALFDRIGMSTAVMEPDASGTFVGSSFMYASARDWARFGLLYALNGVWHGERILPEGWVEYSRTPDPGDARRLYGAHFWLHLPAIDRRAFGAFPDDLFHARGYEGQYVVIIPSRKLVVVRLGLTPDLDAWDPRGLVAGVLDSIASHC